MDFIRLLMSDPRTYFSWILMVVFSVCCHEYAHAQIALWQGDDTAAEAGHLSLNPMKQMGPFSLVILLLIGIAWGQVPVNPYKLKRHYSEAMVAFAGPGMNIILFVVFSLAAAVALGYDNTAAVRFFHLGAMLNIVLFAFNLLPIPPLDGFTVLCFFIPGLKMKMRTSELLKGLSFLLFFVVFMMGHILFAIGARASEFLILLFQFFLGYLGVGGS